MHQASSVVTWALVDPRLKYVKQLGQVLRKNEKKAKVMWRVLQRRLGMEAFHLENGGTISLLSDCKAVAEAEHRDPVQ